MASTIGGGTIGSGTIGGDDNGVPISAAPSGATSVSGSLGAYRGLAGTPAGAGSVAATKATMQWALKGTVPSVATAAAVSVLERRFASSVAGVGALNGGTPRASRILTSATCSGVGTASMLLNAVVGLRNTNYPFQNYQRTIADPFGGVNPVTVGDKIRGETRVRSVPAAAFPILTPVDGASAGVSAVTGSFIQALQATVAGVASASSQPFTYVSRGLYAAPAGLGYLSATVTRQKPVSSSPAGVSTAEGSGVSTYRLSSSVAGHGGGAATSSVKVGLDPRPINGAKSVLSGDVGQTQRLAASSPGSKATVSSTGLSRFVGIGLGVSSETTAGSYGTSVVSAFATASRRFSSDVLGKANIVKADGRRRPGLWGPITGSSLAQTLGGVTVQGQTLRSTVAGAATATLPAFRKNSGLRGSSDGSRAIMTVDSPRFSMTWLASRPVVGLGTARALGGAFRGLRSSAIDASRSDVKAALNARPGVVHGVAVQLAARARVAGDLRKYVISNLRGDLFARFATPRPAFGQLWPRRRRRPGGALA